MEPKKNCKHLVEGAKNLHFFVLSPLTVPAEMPSNPLLMYACRCGCPAAKPIHQRELKKHDKNTYPPNTPQKMKKNITYEKNNKMTYPPVSCYVLHSSRLLVFSSVHCQCHQNHTIKVAQAALYKSQADVTFIRSPIRQNTRLPHLSDSFEQRPTLEKNRTNRPAICQRV